MDEKFVKNSVMDANIDPKFVMGWMEQFTAQEPTAAGIPWGAIMITNLFFVQVFPYDFISGHYTGDYCKTLENIEQQSPFGCPNTLVVSIHCGELAYGILLDQKFLCRYVRAAIVNTKW